RLLGNRKSGLIVFLDRGQFGLACLQLGSCSRDQLFLNEPTKSGIGRLSGKRDQLGRKGSGPDRRWHSWRKRMVLVRVLLVASDKEKRLVIELRVVHPAKPVLGHVWLAAHGVGSDVIRFEHGAKLIVFALENRVVLVIVASRAIDGEAEKGFTC